MKTFKQFILEAYDPEVQGRSQIRKQGQGGRVGAERKKSEPEKRRVRAAGGGKTEPAKTYKARKDIGTQRPRSTREQQPTQARGSAALSAKEAQKKAYLERKAKERGAKTKSASELLAKKPKAKVDPDINQLVDLEILEQVRNLILKKNARHYIRKEREPCVIYV